MIENRRLYSLEQIASQLGLNVRTVRGYVRSGRLKAVRIGKQYRVAREDLEAMTGALVKSDPVSRHRQVEATSVVQIDAVSKESAGRITNHLMGAAKAPRSDALPLRVETVYDEERAAMKIIVIGSLSATADLFRLLGVLLETA
ncbi:MAG TPA: helix-turn-helix domain-containing protein [Steroidobacteraceae bacterium]|jgi:excisionase family DNA binding protein